MLNMLFISDSPKAVYLKNYLQPMLKVIIDIVTDFDQGLKEVFEKRPNTVFIQEQIGGVTGESVANHIQMLLGVGTPRFILMHEGNSKARTVQGLFEHLVDLNQPNESLVEETQKNLKELLGSQWYKIFIPPPSSEIESVVPAYTALPDTPAGSDDQLDALLKDGTKSAAVGENAVTAVNKKPETSIVRNASDEVADLMAAPVVPPPPAPKPQTAPSGQAGLKPQVKPAPVTIAHPQAAPIAPAGFRIRQDSPAEEEPISDELLMAFEQNYRSSSLFLKRSTILIALAVFVCGVGGWYAVRYKPQLTASLNERIKPAGGQRVASVPTAKPAPALLPVTSSQPQSTAGGAPAPAPPPAEKPAPHSMLPKCIPQDGHDVTYAVGHPGWERYVGPQAEFRIFSKGGELKALQVLAVKGSPLSESFVREVTGEFAGSAEYRINSREKKNGVLILSGSIPHTGDIRIYKKNGAVRAFVVSRN